MCCFEKPGGNYKYKILKCAISLAFGDNREIEPIRSACFFRAKTSKTMDPGLLGKVQPRGRGSFPHLEMDAEDRTLLCPCRSPWLGLEDTHRVASASDPLLCCSNQPVPNVIIS
jgi:hypothetical protein